MLAPTPCSTPGCRAYTVAKGKCQEHQTPWAGSTRKSRLPSDWATRRLIVLKRDKGVCYLCGQDNADTVDHVIASDNHNLDNLKAVHDKVAPYCHRFKSSQEGNAVQRGNRIKRRH